MEIFYFQDCTGIGLFLIGAVLCLFVGGFIDENYEINDSACYRIHRLEENLYEDYLPKDYKCEDVITYQWYQNRENNLQGHFNFYYSIAINSVSRASMFLYIVLLLTIGVFGDLLAALIQKLLGM